MRSEKEMLDLILGMAEGDDRIRAVMMNGSRVNSNVPRDIFQDYDIVYFVTDVRAFVDNRSWIKRFGELMIMQTPDESVVPSPGGGDESRFGFLMQFADGNRIDLTFYAVDKISSLDHDSLSAVLLDKDGLLKTLPPADDSDYITKAPTAKQFADCCNEFWWVSTYIAKALWRRELSHAKFLFDVPVRDMLLLMLKWQIGVNNNFTVDSGKHGKYFEKYLEPELWDAFVHTYADGDYDNIWKSLFVMGELFRKTALGVAEHFGYDYNWKEDQNVTAHLIHVKSLPKDAEEVY